MATDLAPPISELTASLNDGKKHLLLAASGSVATIPNIIQALSKHSNLSIRVLLTPSAARFLAGQAEEQPSVTSIAAMPNVDAVYGDSDEWREPWVRGNAILHIELRRWADILVIAPLGANTLAKIVGGMADGILTSVVRAWDARGELDSDVLALRGDVAAAAAGDGVSVPGEAEGGGSGARPRRTRKKRIVVAPAMNVAMWRHPVTAKQIRVLEEEWGIGHKGSRGKGKGKSRGNDNSQGNTMRPSRQEPEIQPDHPRRQDYDAYIEEEDEEVDNDDDDDETGDGWFEVLQPQSKVLACGDRGDGGMCEWTEIVRVIEDRMGLD